MNVLVLGSSGFLAKNILRNLNLNKSLKITKHVNSSIDNSDEDEIFIQVDLLDFNSILEVFKDKRYDIVINCVWYNSSGKLKNDFSMQSKNLLIGLNVVRLAKIVNTKSLVSFGSIHELNFIKNLNSLNNYGLFKFSTQLLMQRLLSKDGINFIYYVIPNLFGNEDLTNNLINRLLDAIFSKEEIILEDNGDLIEFLEVASLSKNLVEHFLCHYKSGVYLVTAGHLNSISYYIDTIKNIVKVESNIKVMQTSNFQNEYFEFLNTLEITTLKIPVNPFEIEFRSLYEYRLNLKSKSF
jgi:nucleoside-diphosphate-sugar epimerase